MSFFVPMMDAVCSHPFYIHLKSCSNPDPPDYLECLLRFLQMEYEMKKKNKQTKTKETIMMVTIRYIKWNGYDICLKVVRCQVISFILRGQNQKKKKNNSSPRVLVYFSLSLFFCNKKTCLHTKKHNEKNKGLQSVDVDVVARTNVCDS